MRIAFHVPRAAYLGPGYSGDVALVAHLIQGLRERGHDVQIVSHVDARELGRRRVGSHRVLIETVRMRRCMRRFQPDAWLVYGPSVTYPDLVGWWQQPARYVLFAADKGRPERLPLRWRALFSAAHRRSVLAADAVAVPRPRSAERMRSLGVEPERIVVLPPAVRVPEASPSREEARRILQLPVDARVVLCVTRFAGRRKDGRPGKTSMVLDLLRGLAQLSPPLVCVVVGDGSGRREVEDERARLGLQDQVRLVGHVPDVQPYYAACDVFAYPYHLDRPWVAVLEAQACGRLVVTLRTDSAELTVVDGVTGLLAHDLAEFDGHLAELAVDGDRCTAMGRAARAYVASNHSIEVRAHQIEELLLA